MGIAKTDDVLERLGDVVEAWPRLMAPDEMTEVRADLVTAAYSHIERLRTERDLLRNINRGLLELIKGMIDAADAGVVMSPRGKSALDRLSAIASRVAADGK